MTGASHVLTCTIPPSLLAATLARSTEGGDSVSHIVTQALSDYLRAPIHTLFQVSTSGALVAGLSSGAVTCGALIQHGDFGLGTFERQGQIAHEGHRTCG